jgi:hypothetical protein
MFNAAKEEGGMRLGPTGYRAVGGLLFAGALAAWEHLWSGLERKIERSNAAGRLDSIPVVRVVLEAHELARGPRHVVLRVT